MEYLKSALSFCCKDCCRKRKDSASSTQIIFPTTKKVSTKCGTLVTQGTFTYLPQPDFYVPLSEDKMVMTRTSPVTKRKQSAPPVMTRTIAIQPISDYTDGCMHKSWGEPTIHIEDSEDSNQNNNSFTLENSGWKSSESINTQSSLSPIHRNVRRLSVVQIAANHSRRSSICSLDISKEDLDSEMYESSELGSGSNSNGELCFTVSYKSELQLLTVCVISARSLWMQEYEQPVLDSFVRVTLLSRSKKKLSQASTTVKKGNSDPSYNEDLQFHNITPEKLDGAVRLSVYSVDRPSKKKKLGIVAYQLCEMSMEATHAMEEKPLWRPLYTNGMVSIFCGTTATRLIPSRNCVERYYLCPFVML